MKKDQPKPAEFWRIIEVPIWDVKVFVYCGPWKSFIERLENSGIEPDNILSNKPHDFNIATTYSRKDGMNVVYSAKPLQPHQLVHELAHATRGIMLAKNVDDDEAFAYTIEYLYKEATK